jgi:hypothetical protein
MASNLELPSVLHYMSEMAQEERAMRLGVAAALMLMATGAMTTAAWADDPMRLAVVSYGKIPAGASFETELFQNTEISNHVASTLKDTLTAHGFRYEPDGRGLVFAINADPTGRGESDQALGITDQNNGQVHITIDTNDTGQSTDTIARGYRITLGIYERESGRYVWRGEINDLKPDADPMTATKPMVEKLVTALEKSLKSTE